MCWVVAVLAGRPCAAAAEMAERCDRCWLRTSSLPGSPGQAAGGFKRSAPNGPFVTVLVLGSIVVAAVTPPPLPPVTVPGCAASPGQGEQHPVRFVLCLLNFHVTAVHSSGAGRWQATSAVRWKPPACVLVAAHGKASLGVSSAFCVLPAHPGRCSVCHCCAGRAGAEQAAPLHPPHSPS